jgi:DNA-directed RNA polymerase subunit K/omega
MAIKTIDVDHLTLITGNIFESVVIAAKRSRQISSKMKGELDSKLSYFEGFEPELEDPRFQEEQLKASLEFEVMNEPTEKALDEMFAGEVYYRDASTEFGF